MRKSIRVTPDIRVGSVFKLRELLNKKPGLIIEKAVKGMLPKTKLGRALFGNLFVYVGSEHPHAAQQPKTININDLR